ncbi:MAG: methylenetetrahydrofolate--tRNA-(uracil(54)-C(5))-methyltransferase (FADH(2)-oxidizing) TrmFO, partial [Clostridia bacterium]|nr:methylenetetrahydrofolate--tRNA-(uracil(54)-C(5))-methyltransferase (FADH(2)-oxidizing) TrmFO [Clostridia bacterium]
MKKATEVLVVGGGLAGSEAAYYLAKRGIKTTLIEMKPKKFTPAHESENYGELVCSNSLKSNDIYANACGLLKEEMRLLGSMIIEAADATKVPAGAALAVDRDKFSAYVTEKLRSLENLTLLSEEVKTLPDTEKDGGRYVIIATGPLTSESLSDDILKMTGGGLHFYDASAPIVSAESVDMEYAFTGDRYGKGTGDYINCPMNKEEYYAFVDALLAAERANLHEFEKGDIFEGCMPVEVMASRGRDTLRYGTLKPVGLADEDGKRPYAVLQLRKENEAGTAYNLVGFQTNLKFPEQKRVFSMIPALHNAEFLRYGVMHRNTFLDSPRLLDRYYRLKAEPRISFAGQMTGVEGYVESAASGFLVGVETA